MYKHEHCLPQKRRMNIPFVQENVISEETIYVMFGKGERVTRQIHASFIYILLFGREDKEYCNEIYKKKVHGDPTRSHPE